ncbi:MAG TPA: hypothetical protein VGQ57_10305, partial [Polyangiaceae bacterium]|nr:hypothetical protein [Polyangiaceae bacterium]
TERARLGRARRFLPLVCALWLWPTWRAVRVWKDDRTLWTATVQMNPASARAWTSLAQVHRIARERDAADQAMERALSLTPDYLAGQIVRIHNDLAFGRLEEAREHIAEVSRRGYRDDEGEFGRAERCVKLDAEAAARCMGP